MHGTGVVCHYSRHFKETHIVCDINDGRVVVNSDDKLLLALGGDRPKLRLKHLLEKVEMRGAILLCPRIVAHAINDEKKGLLSVTVATQSEIFLITSRHSPGINAILHGFITTVNY
jgi:hypothetical protein